MGPQTTAVILVEVSDNCSNISGDSTPCSNIGGGQKKMFQRPNDSEALEVYTPCSVMLSLHCTCCYNIISMICLIWIGVKIIHILFTAATLMRAPEHKICSKTIQFLSWCVVYCVVYMY